MIFRALVVALPFLLLMGPAAIVSLVFRIGDGQAWYVSGVQAALGALLWVASYLAVCTGLGMLTRRAIVPGKFPRDIRHPVYGPRRVYGLSWTAIFYFSPLYLMVLSVPFLKKWVFRAFGYRGPLDFVTYPDTWIRDLPLLQLGKGAYLSNKSTIGTNICLSDGTILVMPVKVGEKGLVGHMTMLGPGAVVEDGAEVGVGVAFGIKARLGARAKIQPAAVVNHGAKIGDDAEIGTAAYIGLKAVIGNGVKVSGGASVPPGAVVENQEQANDLFGAEREALKAFARESAMEMSAAMSRPEGGRPEGLRAKPVDKNKDREGNSA